MHSPKQSNAVLLLLALPLLATAVLVYLEHSQRPASARTQLALMQSPKLVTSDASAAAGSLDSSFRWTPTAAQKLILNQRWKKSRTLPISITAAGSSLSSANAVYALKNGFDGNGFKYYQSPDGTQYCQWSTMNHCWCIRSFLVRDSPDVRPGAEYLSYGKQTYASGPAGQYWFGGMCPMIRNSAPPFVTALKPSQD